MRKSFTADTKYLYNASNKEMTKTKLYRFGEKHNDK
jgi:hypothetical protein